MTGAACSCCGERARASSETLALPNHFSILDVLLTCFPLFTNKLDGCIDLAEAEWQRNKRKLSLGTQRRQLLKPLDALVEQSRARLRLLDI